MISEGLSMSPGLPFLDASSIKSPPTGSYMSAAQWAFRSINEWLMEAPLTAVARPTLHGSPTRPASCALGFGLL